MTSITVLSQFKLSQVNKGFPETPRTAPDSAITILLSLAILFSVVTHVKALRMLSHLKVACFTDETFCYHQKRYPQPAVVSVWGTKQSVLLAQCKTVRTPMTVGSDGQAGSHSHYTKYRSYGIIDLATNKVIEMNEVSFGKINIRMYDMKEILFAQSNEVMSSNRMEKEGPARDLDFVSAGSLEVKALITERHSYPVNQKVGQ